MQAIFIIESAPVCAAGEHAAYALRRKIVLVV
jgi:hypothetical protein